MEYYASGVLCSCRNIASTAAISLFRNDANLRQPQLMKQTFPKPKRFSPHKILPIKHRRGELNNLKNWITWRNRTTLHRRTLHRRKQGSSCEVGLLRSTVSILDKDVSNPPSSCIFMYHALHIILAAATWGLCWHGKQCIRPTLMCQASRKKRQYS